MRKSERYFVEPIEGGAVTGDKYGIRLSVLRRETIDPTSNPAKIEAVIVGELFMSRQSALDISDGLREMVEKADGKPKDEKKELKPLGYG